MDRPFALVPSLLVIAACSSQGEPVTTDARNSGADGASDAVSRTSGPLARAQALWVGDTELGYDGWSIPTRLVQSRRALDVSTQTWPGGRATTATLFWKVGGVVSSRSMDRWIPRGGSVKNTQWKATIPAEVMEDGRTIEYWIRAADATGNAVWDSDNGRNHRLTPHDEVTLFDGTSSGWRMAGRGSFALEGAITGTPFMAAHPADGLGLYWSTFPIPPSFELTLEFRMSDPNDNSGVVLSFPDPDAFGYENTAWVGVHYGVEVQIDEIARPDGAPFHRTGAIYGEPGQTLSLQSARSPGTWSRYVIRLVGRTYSVELDGHEVSRLTWNGDPNRPLRALPAAPGAPRFVGVQAHTGVVSFRDVRLKVL